MAKPDRVLEAIAFLKLAKKAEDAQRTREKEDLRFQVPELAWSEEAKQARAGQTVNGVPIPARPMLSLATLDEPIQLVENAYRDAHLGVNIHPLSPDATDDTAQVLQGIYRSIEVHSRAAAVPRAWGFARSLWCGRGMYRVISEYDPDGGAPGDQRLVLKRILYQDSVYLDPFAQEPDWSDGERAAIISDVQWDTYKRKYKTSTLAQYSDGDLLALGEDAPDWVGGDEPEARTVRIAEFFYVEHEETSVTIPGAGRDGKDITITTDKRHVKWCTVNGVEELASGDWPGPYIPIIPTIGKELQPFDGKRQWIGMATNAKSAVNLVNVAASGVVEMAILEPKAPWHMEEGQDAGYEWEYQQANIRNFPVLHYRMKNLEGERAAGPPTRVQVDASRLGPNMMLLSMGKDFVQSATQTFEPALGKQTPAHRSGEAIKALQGQTLEGTSNYTSNLAEISMTLEAKILLYAIPHFYDRAGRIVQILDGEQKPRTVMLNQPFVKHPDTGQPVGVPPVPQGMTPPAPVYHYDLNKGRYGVTVKIGKSSDSKQEAAQAQLGEIMQSDPALVPIIGPNFFESFDEPWMRSIATLLKKQRDHAMPWLSDNPTQPNAQQLQQLEQQHQQLVQHVQALTQTIQTKQVETDGKFKIAQMQEQAETQRAALDRETKLAVAELSARVERLAMFLEERARIGAHIQDVSQGMRDKAHQVGTSAMEHEQALELGAQTHQQAMQQADQAHQQGLEAAVQQAALQPQDTSASGGTANSA